MSADLSQVLPGWRGTDRKGGTWVRVAWIGVCDGARVDPMLPWMQITADGTYYAHTQEEAEAAGLVPLAETDVKAAVDAYVTAVAVERAELTAALADARSAAPAPLDPGNPEHLRQVAEFLQALSRKDRGVDDVWFNATWLLNRADRLDREHAEAEQDAADRKLAHKVAAATKQDFTLLAESYQEEIQRHVLAGIRAERARQEAGQ